ncbi:MAG TPA: YncE family protein, partial [Anaerolineae bacterium]
MMLYNFQRAALAAACFTVIIVFSSPVSLPTRVSALSNPCGIDPNNLITNGSMAAGGPDPGVANYWHRFTLGGAPTFEHVDNEQIDPNGSQYIWEDASAFDAGIYQTVTGLLPGQYYHLWWGYALAAYDPGTGVNLRGNWIGRQLGVDLTGGTNPLAPNVAWGSIFWNGQAALNIPDLSRTFPAQTDRATFFLRVINTNSLYRNKAWIDSICMEPTTAPPVKVYLPLVLRSQVSPPPSCTVGNLATIPVGAHPKGVAVDPTSDRVYTGLYDDSSVAEVDAGTNQKVATWSTNNPGHANGIGFTDGRLVVSLKDTATAVVLDAITGAVLSNRQVGADPYGVGASNGKAWIANFASNTVSIMDASTGVVTATTNVGGSPSLVAAGSDRTFVSYWAGGVAVIAGDGTLLQDFTATGAGSFGVAFSPSANRLYVSNRTTNQLFVLDATTGSVINSVTLTQTPYALAVNPGTNHLFVVVADPINVDDPNRVDVRDANTLSRIVLLSTGSQGTGGGDG